MGNVPPRMSGPIFLRFFERLQSTFFDKNKVTLLITAALVCCMALGAIHVIQIESGMIQGTKDDAELLHNECRQDVKIKIL